MLCLQPVASAWCAGQGQLGIFLLNPAEQHPEGVLMEVSGSSCGNKLLASRLPAGEQAVEGSLEL